MLLPPYFSQDTANAPSLAVLHPVSTAHIATSPVHAQPTMQKTIAKAPKPAPGALFLSKPDNRIQFTRDTIRALTAFVFDARMFDFYEH